MAPLLMLIDSSRKEKEFLKENLKFILAEKEKTGNVQLRYIEDIHVMVVFVAC
jgi:hypothetical protein